MKNNPETGKHQLEGLERSKRVGGAAASPSGPFWGPWGHRSLTEGTQRLLQGHPLQSQQQGSPRPHPSCLPPSLPVPGTSPVATSTPPPLAVPRDEDAAAAPVPAAGLAPAGRCFVRTPGPLRRRDKPKNSPAVPNILSASARRPRGRSSPFVSFPQPHAGESFLFSPGPGAGGRKGRTMGAG